jgi:hypothetical protein
LSSAGGASAGAGGAAGTANRGGGGGGGYSDNATGSSGAAGGSGVFIASYVGSGRAIGGAITTSGDRTIHTLTSSGTFTVYA